MKILATDDNRRAILYGPNIAFQENTGGTWRTIFRFHTDSLDLETEYNEQSQTSQETTESPPLHHTCQAIPDREGRTLAECPGCVQQSHRDGYYLGFIQGVDKVTNAIQDALKKAFSPLEIGLTSQMAHTRLNQLLKMRQITRETQKAAIQALEYHKPIPPANRDDLEQDIPKQEEPRDGTSKSTESA